MPDRSYRWALLALGLFGFVADQATKYGVFNWLYEPGKLHGSRQIIPGSFELLAQLDPTQVMPGQGVLTRWNGPVPPRVNHGALFSLGGEHKETANLFFGVVSVAAAVGILVWAFRKNTATDRVLCVALGLILGGTTGNMFDRFVFGGVRDFLNFYLINWPVFNVADCCLVCGAGLLLVQAFLAPKPPTPAENKG